MAGIQILVVEDDALQAKLVSLLLEDAGHTVQMAGSAESALDVLQWFRPDLILMDLQLPGKDGLALTRELRLIPIYVATPIIALTAYTDASHLARAREAGCDATISKPIDTEAFARQVRSCLGSLPGTGDDVPSDSGDLLAEMRNNFLAAGLDQCGTILTALKSNRQGDMGVVTILRRWAGVGETLGFPEISNQARSVEGLFTLTGRDRTLKYEDDAVQAIDTMRRRFYAATRNETKLPLEVILGLKDMRIGLIDFSNEEAGRIRRVARNAHVQVVMEQIQSVSVLEDTTGYGALVVNECDVSRPAPPNRPQWLVPAVFIGSRSSLGSLAKLPARAYDFVLAPWDAEEVLLRVFRLVGKTAALQPAEGAAHLQKRRPRILIADDDPDLVSLVLETLRQSGMDSDIARTGQQALDKVSRHAPDAIVLDVNMLGLNGFEVLAKLRHNLATKAIPVMLLTARSQESDIGLGFGSGADDYVVKPFRPSDLAERVGRMISARRRPA